MKKKDLWIIVAAALCAAVLLVGSQFIKKTPKQGHVGAPEGVTIDFQPVQPSANSGKAFSWLFASASAEETEEAAPEETEEAAPEEAAPEEEPAAQEPAPVNLDEETIAALEAYGLYAAESYLVVWMGDYFQPVPLLEEYDGQLLRIALTEDDYNIVKVTKNGFDMHEASCPDQVCVTEGEVTLENRSERILGSFIICMPNNIVLEMYDAQEMLELLAQSYVDEPVQEEAVE